MRDAKPCTKCEVVKPLESFYVNRSKKDGRTSECKRCFLAGQKARAANKKAQGRWHWMGNYARS